MNRSQAPATAYSRGAIVLHWTIAALVLANLPIGILAGDLEGAASDNLTAVHKQMGFLVLVFTLIRIWWRLRHAPPPLPESASRWLRVLATLTHKAFYALLLAIPLSGWWMTSAVAEHPVRFLLFDVPYLPVPRGMDSARAAFAVHETLGFIIMAMVVLHVAAALKHHFIDKDHVFTRMLGCSAGQGKGEGS